MEVFGYKCFNGDMTNSYGIKFDVGKEYLTEGKVKFGTKGNGFHMCKKMEDTLRFFYADKENVCICEVKGSGKIVESSDEYYGYYDMYSVERLEIIRKLSRKEIVDMVIGLSQERVIRFIMSFKLTEEEIVAFKNKYKNNDMIVSYIEYYQEKKTDAFARRIKRLTLK